MLRNSMGALAEIAYEIDPACIMEASGKVPDEWQARILRRRPPRLILNCSRQSGKSAVVSAMAVDEVMRNPEALVLAVCPSERQSKMLIDSTRDIYEATGSKLRESAQSTTHLEFPNGAHMWALPSKEANVRGFSAVTLLIIDEASRVPDDLYNAVRPMLAVSRGRLALLSTPFGKRGFFHREWTEGEGWEKVRITARECPRISAEDLAQEKRTLPDSWFRQEYMCEFADTDGAVFAYDDVQRAFTTDVQPLFSVAGGDAEVERLFQ